MNVRDQGMWPLGSIPYDHTDPVAWHTILVRREATFLGFCEREARKGLVSLPVSLNTPRGQDIVRLYAFRALEEYNEALEAHDHDHVLEELIDSFNYWISLYFLEGKDWPIARDWPVYFGNIRPNLTDLGSMTARITSTMDLFRNRSWMENSQDIYFGGYGQLTQAIGYAVNLIASCFPDWNTFWSFFIAKDNVLQFRLRTNY